MRFLNRLLLGVIALGIIIWISGDWGKQKILSVISQKIHDNNEVFASNNTVSSNNTEDVAISRQNAITRAVERLSPAVVGINATAIQYYSYSPLAQDQFWRMFFPDQVYEQKVPSLGSGFIISSDGLVLTNEHVIGEAKVENIIVTTTDGEKHKVEWVKKDDVTDITLLKIAGKGFTSITFGNSDDIIIGEWAIALGNPFGLFAINSQPSVTVGVISATKRDFGLVEEKRVYKDMIQTDASINPGNSGGPLANSLGEVIGMNTFIYTGSQYSQGSVGVGFAIPSNRIKDIVNEIQRFGKVDRSYETGIEVLNVDRYIAHALGLRSAQGVYISKVERNSSGYRAGVQPGDIILSLNGRKIENANDPRRIIRELELHTGDFIELEILRDNKVIKLKVLLEEARR